MRLLNTESLELEFFPARNKPKYAILSHTWGSAEVTFDDARHGKTCLLACQKEGLKKVLGTVSRAKLDGFGYIWIDTCCIDKSSSAELSEAINSMFAWYNESSICYAFLPDVQLEDGGKASSFAASRWFTRGWTLQELIAPDDVHFYGASWIYLGDRRTLSPEIASITGIDERVLHRHHGISCAIKYGQKHNCPDCGYSIPIDLILLEFSISTRMSWAASRETTRVEDTAYCLLGIFDITMPLLYGEGWAAFRRLQELITQLSADQTILTWQASSGHPAGINQLFASHPAMFSFGARYRPAPRLPLSLGMTLSHAGLELEVHLAPCTLTSDYFTSPAFLAILNCGDVQNDFSCTAIVVRRTTLPELSFIRSYIGGEICPPFCIHRGPQMGNVVIRSYTNSVESTIGELQFDPAKLERRKILLLRGNIAAQYELPQVHVIFPEGCGSYEIEQVMPSKRIRISRRTFPIRINDRFIHGSIGLADGKGDGFVVLWGFSYLTSSPELSAYNPRGWVSKCARPFCEVLRSPPFHLLTGYGDIVQERQSICDLCRIAEQSEQRTNVLADSSDESAGVFSSSWINNRGDRVSVTAKSYVQEFLGRSKCEVALYINID